MNTYKKQANHRSTEALRAKYLTLLCTCASLWFICLLVSPAPAQTNNSQGDQPQIVTGSPPQTVTGDSPQIVILDNEIYANNVSAVNIQGNRVSVEKCTIYQNGNAGIVVDNDAQALIQNNRIYSQEGAGITVMGAGSAQVSIIGNQIHQNKMAGLQLGSKDRMVVPVHRSFKKNPSVILAQGGNQTNKGFGQISNLSKSLGDKTKGEDGKAKAGDKIQEGLTTITVDIQNNRIYHNGESGIKCQSEYPQHSIFLTAEYNAIFQNRKGGILVANAAKVALRNNSIYENHKAGVSANRSKGPSPIPQVDIYQNIIRGNEESGLELTGACSGPIGVCNNLIFHNGGSGIRFGASTMRIINNTIVSNGNLSQGSGIDQQEKSIPFIANNILAYNFKTGLNIKRQKGYSHNLFFANGGSGTCCDDCYSSSKFTENKQLGGRKRNQGDMICDPGFSNPDLFDFRLNTWSPAIDGGIPSPEFEDLHFPPSQGGRQNDMGVTGGPLAFSWDPNAPVP